MPDITEDTQTFRSLLCEALHVIEQSRQMLAGVRTSKRADIVRNMGAIETQIEASPMIFDKLNAVVDQVDGNTVVSAKVKDHPIITELMERNAAGKFHVRVELIRHEDSVTGLAYKVDGFYKSGDVTLIPLASGELRALARYNEVSELSDFSDLVSLNHTWWRRGRDRGFTTPAPGWADWMVEFGYVKVKTVITKEYT